MGKDRPTSTALIIMMAQERLRILSYTNVTASFLFAFGSRRIATFAICGNRSRLYFRIMSKRGISRLLNSDAGNGAMARC